VEKVNTVPPSSSPGSRAGSQCLVPPAAPRPGRSAQLC